MKIRLASPLVTDSIVDGVGLRTTIFVQGCKRGCPGCHNPQTWDVSGGFESDSEKIIAQLKKVKMQDGITLSGGEPFLQAAPLVEIAKFAHTVGWNVWTFTGYCFEELQQGEKAWRDLLKQIDILVDGPFVLAKRSVDLFFKGSTNQCTLRLKNGVVVEQLD